MKSLRSTGVLNLCLILFFMSMGMASVAQKSKKEKQEIEMFIWQADDSLIEINRETAVLSPDRAAMDRVPYQHDSVINHNNIYYARLIGEKATIRYIAGQKIRIVALLPNSIVPSTIELLSYGK